MSPHITTWGDNEHVISPVGSSTPSIVSVESILLDPTKNSLDIDENPRVANSRIKWIGPQATKLPGNRTSVGMNSRADDPYIRHPKYFFMDGNITFLVEGTLYCVHRYFFSRDSVYFSTRFAQLDVRDHEALQTIISLSDVECKDFDAFLSILYPENFEDNGLCYEEWKSVLHLSTRWGFASIRKLALSSIEPPTPHDRLLLARMYSVDDWVVPALSALCERATPLTLSEAQQMNIEDVVLVATVREDIRGRTVQVDRAEIPPRVKAKQLGALGLEIPSNLRLAKAEPSPVDMKGATKDYESDGERSVSPGLQPVVESSWSMELTRLQGKEEARGNIGVKKREPAEQMKNNQREVAETRTVKTRAKKPRTAKNKAIQQGDPEMEDSDGAATITPTPTLNGKPPVTPANEKLEAVSPEIVGSESAAPALPSYPVGRGISLPFGQLLPRCARCSCCALIATKHRYTPEANHVLCLDHGLFRNSATRDLVLLTVPQWSMNLQSYDFISPEHEAAIRAFLA